MTKRNLVKARLAFGEWVEYDKKDKHTRVPLETPVQVMIRTPYKTETGEPFYYCPKAKKVSPWKMRNLSIPLGRRGCYFDVRRILKWRYVNE